MDATGRLRLSYEGDPSLNEHVMIPAIALNMPSWFEVSMEKLDEP